MSFTQPEMKRERERERERGGEKKGVGEEVGVNNSYCKSSEETANDPRGELESAGPRHSQQSTNITALQRAGWL